MIRKFILLLMFLLQLYFSNSMMDNSVYVAEARFDSLTDWYHAEQGKDVNLLAKIADILSTFYNCVSNGYFLAGPPSDYANFCLPKILSMSADNNVVNECKNKGNRTVPFSLLGMVGGGVALAALVLFSGVWLAPLMIIIGAIEVLILTSAIFPSVENIILDLLDKMFGGCLTAFAMTPTEYIGIKEHKILFKDKELIYMEDFGRNIIPYFYHCDALSTNVSNYEEMNDANKVAVAQKFFGYLGNALCQNAMFRKYGDKYKDLIGSIIICKVNIEQATGGRESLLYDSKFIDDHCAIIKADNNVDIDKVHDVNGLEVTTYYSMNNSKIQRCAINSAWIAWGVVGCSSIAPPVILQEYSITNKKLLNETRCRYLSSIPRTDLYSVGADLLSKSDASSDPSLLSVPGFLLSNFHPFDTMIGCISDILNQMISGYSGSSSGSFLLLLQSSIHAFVLGCLSLYLMLLGLKILNTGGEIQKSEIMMYIMKILLVAFLGLTDIWLPTNNIINSPNQSGERHGLYSIGMKIMEKTIDLFLNVSAISDPLKMCYYPYKNGNLLRSVEYDGKSIVATASPGNASNVIFTPWTLLECKFMNLINWSSCRYELSMSPLLLFIGVQFGSVGYILTALVGALIINFNFAGLILAVMSIIFLLFAVLMFARYLYCVLLSIIALTLLVIVAPLMSCFILFELTKDIFNNWLKALVAFTLFPGLFVTQLVLSISVMDVVLYGNQKYIMNLKSGSADLNELCMDNDSIFCTMLGDKRRHPCLDVQDGPLINRFIDNTNITIRRDALPILFAPFLYLILFLYLFYNLGTKIGDFISGLISIPAFGNFMNAISMSSIKKLATENAVTSTSSTGKNLIQTALSSRK